MDDEPDVLVPPEDVFSSDTHQWVLWRLDESGDSDFMDSVHGLVNLMVASGQDLICAERIFAAEQASAEGASARWRDARHSWPLSNDDWDAYRASFGSRTQIIAARAFVLAMWNLKSAVWMLAKPEYLGDRAPITSALATLDAAFPDLMGLRDSLAHPEDRYRQKIKRRGKPSEDIPLLVSDGIREPDYFFMSTGAEDFGGIQVGAFSIVIAADAAETVMRALRLRPFLSGRPSWPPHEPMLDPASGVTSFTSPWWREPRQFRRDA